MTPKPDKNITRKKLQFDISHEHRHARKYIKYQTEPNWLWKQEYVLYKTKINQKFLKSLITKIQRKHSSVHNTNRVNKKKKEAIILRNFKTQSFDIRSLVQYNVQVKQL